MTIPTLTPRMQPLINGIFIAGLLALLTGLYLVFGLGWALIGAGALLVTLSIIAALMRTKPDVNPTV